MIIVETFSDGDKYLHHENCFDLQVAVDLNRILKLGDFTVEAKDTEEFINNNDGRIPTCFLCLEGIK